MDKITGDRLHLSRASDPFGDPPLEGTAASAISYRLPEIAPDHLSTLASSGRSVRLFTAPGLPEPFELSRDIGTTRVTAIETIPDR